jgi:hypothetical protein
MAAVFADNTEKDTYIDESGGTYSTPQEGGSTSKARFELEPETNRLFTHLVDGTKVYLFTVIPDGPNYAFQFDTAANIDNVDVYHYVLCTADADNVLSCASESNCSFQARVTSSEAPCQCGMALKIVFVAKWK